MDRPVHHCQRPKVYPRLSAPSSVTCQASELITQVRLPPSATQALHIQSPSLPCQLQPTVFVISASLSTTATDFLLSASLSTTAADFLVSTSLSTTATDVLEHHPV